MRLTLKHLLLVGEAVHPEGQVATGAAVVVVVGTHPNGFATEQETGAQGCKSKNPHESVHVAEPKSK